MEYRDLVQRCLERFWPCSMVWWLLLTSIVAAQVQPESTPNGGQSDSADPLNFRRNRQLSNAPDDVGYQLQESEERIDALFRVGPLTPLHDCWDSFNRCAKESISLDLGLNYTAVYQRADTTVRGPRDSADGDLDFFGRWLISGCENCWPGAIVFNSESRHRFTAIAPNDLDTGAVGGTIVGFDTQDFSLVQLYWEQGSFDDGPTVPHRGDRFGADLRWWALRKFQLCLPQPRLFGHPSHAAARPRPRCCGCRLPDPRNLRCRGYA